MEIETLWAKVVVLNLDTEEKNWLQGVMKNPLYGVTPDDEDPYDRHMRIKLFLALRAED